MAEREPSKTELVERTLDDVKRLVKTGARDVAQDFRMELESAGATGVLWGVGGLLAAAGLTALFISLGLRLSRVPAGGTVAVGLGLLAGSAGLVAAGWQVLPEDLGDKVEGKVEAAVAQHLS